MAREGLGAVEEAPPVGCERHSVKGLPSVRGLLSIPIVLLQLQLEATSS